MTQTDYGKPRVEPLMKPGLTVGVWSMELPRGLSPSSDGASDCQSGSWVLRQGSFLNSTLRQLFTELLYPWYIQSLPYLSTSKKSSQLFLLLLLVEEPQPRPFLGLLIFVLLLI